MVLLATLLLSYIPCDDGMMCDRYEPQGPYIHESSALHLIKDEEA